jgi:hypothetical protein
MILKVLKIGEPFAFQLNNTGKDLFNFVRKTDDENLLSWSFNVSSGASLTKIELRRVNIENNIVSVCDVTDFFSIFNHFETIQDGITYYYNIIDEEIGSSLDVGYYYIYFTDGTFERKTDIFYKKKFTGTNTLYLLKNGRYISSTNWIVSDVVNAPPYSSEVFNPDGLVIGLNTGNEQECIFRTNAFKLGNYTKINFDFKLFKTDLLNKFGTIDANTGFSEFITVVNNANIRQTISINITENLNNLYFGVYLCNGISVNQFLTLYNVYLT